MTPKTELSAAIARNVRRLRVERGMSQEELAQKAGCHRVTVNRVEQGERLPEADVLFALADAMDVSTDELRQIAEIFST